MIKLVQCVRKLPHLTVDQFRQAWEVYAERLRSAAIELGAVRVTLSTTLETPLNDALAESRGSAAPFDGVAEIAWLRGAEILGDASHPATWERIVRLRGFPGDVRRRRPLGLLLRPRGGAARRARRVGDPGLR